MKTELAKRSDASEDRTQERASDIVEQIGSDTLSLTEGSDNIDDTDTPNGGRGIRGGFSDEFIEAFRASQTPSEDHATV